MKEQECEARPCKRLPPDVLEAQSSGTFCELVKQLRTGQTHRQLEDVSAATESNMMV